MTMASSMPYIVLEYRGSVWLPYTDTLYAPYIDALYDLPIFIPCIRLQDSVSSTDKR